MIKCKVCKLMFKKTEVLHQITHKMIMKMKAHWDKRGMFQLDHLNRFKDPMRTTTVCDLCYMIIIAEHELINTE